MTGVYGASTVGRRRRTGEELATLDEAIIEAVEVEAPVTLRGVFYRCVSAGAIEKTELGYRAVGRQLIALRRAGRVSYRDITDGTRWIVKPDSYDSVEAALTETARLYRRNLWSRSPFRIAVFTEKDAITGVIMPVTEEWDVPLGVLRGYCSESFAWRVAAGLNRQRHNLLVQLGDHDPSGVGAWDDFQKKVSGFAPAVSVEFHRLAVTEEQIAIHALPTRPTKTSDPRSKGWEGGESVEVDAIAAPELRRILGAFIAQHVDHHQLEVLRTVEAEERGWLETLARSER